MIKWFLKRQVDKFERNWNYDSAYMRRMIDVDPKAAIEFSKVMGIAGYRKDVPLDAYFAAKIIGVMSEDCGPCTQLVFDMAERSGVPPSLLRAILDDDRTAMGETAALAVDFARASLAHAPQADELRRRILDLWGERALLSLSFALVAARIFPTLKYALGHGQSCMRVTVGGQASPVARPLAVPG